MTDAGRLEAAHAPAGVRDPAARPAPGVLRVSRGALHPAREARIEAEVRAGDGDAAGRDEVLILVGGPPPSVSIPRLRTLHEPASGVRAHVRAVAGALRLHRPRVVHAHGFDAAIVARLASWRTGLRPLRVYEVHGAVAFESLYRNRGPLRWARFAALYALETAAILLSSRLLLVSDEIARYYPAARLRPRVSVPRLVAEPAGDASPVADAELDRFRAFARTARAKVAPIAVYSGGTAAWQLTRETIALMAALERDAGFRVAVLTTEPGEFTALAREGGAPVEGWFVGRLARESVGAALGACQVGVILRDDVVLNRVASPTKLYEYLHAGLAVVTTAGVPAGAAAITRTGNGVVADLRALRSDPGYARSLAASVLDVVRKRGDRPAAAAPDGGEDGWAALRELYR
ncbi:MAG TPA: glycosyltransferase [Longimicrobiaceae bacterium]|nr:glycosyltransferase [Longimicrobiaceae bacterium]